MTLKEVKNEYKALAVGDGIVGGKKKNGQWVVHVIEFPNGGPFYLKYQIFNEVSQWKTQFGGRYKIKTYTGDILSSGLDFPEWIESSPPNLAQRIDQWLEVIEYREKICDFDENSPYNQFVFPKDEFEFAFVASDGLESFYIPVKTRKSKYNQPVFVLDVLRVLLNFVTIRPGFARLQSNWMFRQDKNGTFKRRNWLNGDDVSLGIIHD